MIVAGPRNAITDVPGIQVGNAEDHGLTTGTTVVLPDEPAVCAVDHRGGGIGSRDTVTLSLGSVVEQIHAVCLSGGSAYGLDAAGGVMHGLRAIGRGFEVGTAVVPLVPQAIIFDLLTGAAPDWKHPPWWELGRRALDAAGSDFAQGNAGAGLGATAGPLKGGLGSASYRLPDYTIGALAVANPMGECVIPGTDTLWSWMLEQDAEMGGQTPPESPLSSVEPAVPAAPPGSNTTLVVVATDATLDRNTAQRVAIMAQDGLARAIRPVHAPLDGDTVFVLSTGRAPAPATLADVTRLGSLAADVTARAIARGVYEAEPLAGFPSYRERHGR